jgi:hypothetical protein
MVRSKGSHQRDHELALLLIWSIEGDWTSSQEADTGSKRISKVVFWQK